MEKPSPQGEAPKPILRRPALLNGVECSHVYQCTNSWNRGLAMYDFDRIIDRHNTFSAKWNVLDNELPMWVADMDFETAPEILDVIKARAAHGVFGYNDIPDRWNEAICSWWKRRHCFAMEPENLVFCTGVIAALSSIVRKFTTPAEKIVLQSPVYNCFCNSIENNGRLVLRSRLSIGDGSYCMDFDDLEEKFADPQTAMMVLCNPHNPVGRIWSASELRQVGELAAKYNVLVVSDEIHCDLTDPGYSYVPYASVSPQCAENSITLIAPTKTFNLAGLHTAAIYAQNPKLRHRAWRAVNTDEVGEPGTFAIEAAVAAYEQGDAWLDELREYVTANKQLVHEMLAKKLPQAEITPSHATYLLWVNLGNRINDVAEFCKQLRKETGLWITPGTVYGPPSQTQGYVRINIACPKAYVEDGMTRLIKGYNSYTSAWGISL